MIDVGFKSIILHYSDTRTGLPIEKPDEDFVDIQGNAFASFDGVTLLWQIPYPNPSPAFESAKGMAEVVLKTLNADVPLVGQAKVAEAFRRANEWNMEFNKTLGITQETIDYLETQYASAVGSAGYLKDSTLYCGHVNDCGVLVCSPEGNTLLSLEVDSERHERYLNYLRGEKIYNDGIGEHVYFRKNVVNADIDFEDGKVDFGVLTGEEKALDFVLTGEVEISKGCMAIFYTDGFAPILHETKLVEFMLENKNKEDVAKEIETLSETNQRFQKEKSMVVVYFE
jgi:serine/threonine protein phosphatase PrpC